MTAAIPNSDHPTRPKLPNPQKTIACTSYSVATYCSNEVAAENRNIMATPPRISVSGRLSRSRAKPSAANAVNAANTKAFPAIPHCDAPPSRIASAAPKAAPEEMPSVKGEANGFRSTACTSVPLMASPAPTSAPMSTRGRRRRTKSANSCSENPKGRRTTPFPTLTPKRSIHNATKASSPKRRFCRLRRAR